MRLSILPQLQSSSVFLCSQFLYLFFFLNADAAPELVEKTGDNSLTKLKALYTHAKELSENEVRYTLSSFYNSDKFHFLFSFSFLFYNSGNISKKHVLHLI
jgi:hypothetical protein